MSNSEQQDENHEQLKIRNIPLYCAFCWTEESSEPENRLGLEAEKVAEYQAKHRRRGAKHHD